MLTVLCLFSFFLLLFPSVRHQCEVLREEMENPHRIRKCRQSMKAIKVVLGERYREYKAASQFSNAHTSAPHILPPSSSSSYPRSAFVSMMIFLRIDHPTLPWRQIKSFLSLLSDRNEHRTPLFSCHSAICLVCVRFIAVSHPLCCSSLLLLSLSADSIWKTRQASLAKKRRDVRLRLRRRRGVPIGRRPLVPGGLQAWQLRKSQKYAMLKPRPADVAPPQGEFPAAMKVNDKGHGQAPHNLLKQKIKQEKTYV